MLTILGVNTIIGFGFESTQSQSQNLISGFSDGYSDGYSGGYSDGYSGGYSDGYTDGPLRSITSLDYPLDSNESVEEMMYLLDMNNNVENKSTSVIIKTKTQFQLKLSQSLAKPVSQLSNDWSLISQQIIMLLVVKILLL